MSTLAEHVEQLRKIEAVSSRADPAWVTIACVMVAAHLDEISELAAMRAATGDGPIAALVKSHRHEAEHEEGFLHARTVEALESLSAQNAAKDERIKELEGRK